MPRSLAVSLDVFIRVYKQHQGIPSAQRLSLKKCFWAVAASASPTSQLFCSSMAQSGRKNATPNDDEWHGLNTTGLDPFTGKRPSSTAHCLHDRSPLCPPENRFPHVASTQGSWQTLSGHFEYLWISEDIWGHHSKLLEPCKAVVYI